ncbi:MAG: phosphoribosylglycinamide formyltransferase [Candidatus Micrarchaeia archaeon]
MAFKVAVLASGRGSNFKAMVQAKDFGGLLENVEFCCLITDNPAAPAIAVAKERSIPVHVLQPKDYPDRIAHDNAMLEALEKSGCDLIVLAGYMRIIKSPELLGKFKNRIINIHPSLLPKYPGSHAQKDAFDAGEKVSGLTIHFVDASLDGGPIIYQEKVDISSCKSGQEAADAILRREHIAYPAVVDWFSKGMVRVAPGGKVAIDDGLARKGPRKRQG